MSFLGYDLSTTQDLLNMTLTIGFAAIAIALVMVLVRVYRVLKKVDSVAENVTNIADIVQHYLWQPARFAKIIMDKAQKFIKK